MRRVGTDARNRITDRVAHTLFSCGEADPRHQYLIEVRGTDGRNKQEEHRGDFLLLFLLAICPSLSHLIMVLHRPAPPLFHFAASLLLRVSPLRFTALLLFSAQMTKLRRITRSSVIRRRVTARLASRNEPSIEAYLLRTHRSSSVLGFRPRGIIVLRSESELGNV